MPPPVRALNVLGLHALSHDAGAALIAGERVRSIGEERLSRRKFDDAFPERAIRYLLADAGLSLADVDLAVVDHLERRGPATIEALRALGYAGPAVAIRHHDAHAAGAFFCSPFDDAAVLVVDGGGSFGEDHGPGGAPHYAQTLEPLMYEAQSLYRGTGRTLALARRTCLTRAYPFGVGYFYELATRYLGFGSLGGGKTMGLAPYGKGTLRPAEPIFRDFDGDVVVAGDGPLDGGAPLDYYKDRYFGGIPPRRAGEPLDGGHAEIAHLAQRELEEAMLGLARNARAVTRADRLCLTGGVTLNCVANRRILAETEFREAFFQPACSDTGIPLGCALYGAHVLGGRERFWRMENAFLGREYAPAEMERALAAHEGEGVRVARLDGPEALAREVAHRLADGEIVGWFQGASELGPRSLGNRSILCDPRRERMKDILNQRVKLREGFRPFAPVALAERAADYFEIDRESPFMLLIAPVRPHRRAEIPAVVHVDGSARVQTVARKDNPRLRALLEAFDAATGVPVLLNTSFNVAGEPIVETPEDALRCFLGNEIDCLALGDLLVAKPPEVRPTGRRARRAGG